MSKAIIGVVGPGNASPTERQLATELGKLIASEGWILLTGGRDVGVMNAALKGAREAGGLTLGILPSEDKSGASEHLDIAICTGMNSARNNINILTSDVIVACGIGAGTTSEIMLALKAGKPLFLLAPSQKLVDFIGELDYPLPKVCDTPKEVIPFIRKRL